MRHYALLTVVFLWAATAAASGDNVSPRVGTELNPEIADPPGDVTYDPAYVGDQNRDHLDVLASWFEYLPAADVIFANIKVGSLAAVRTGVDGGYEYAHCGIETPATTHGRPAGNFDFNFLLRPNGTTSSSVNFIRAGASEGPDLPHSLEIKWTTPGYVSFALDRAVLQSYATVLEGEMYVSCVESRQVLPVLLSQNFDSARASATYDVSAATRPGSTGGPDDELPWDSQAPTGTSLPAERTTAPALLAGLLVIAGVAVGHRLRTW